MGNVTYLGDFQDTISVYLIDGKAIIDPGPYSITEEVLEAIKSKGFDPKEIRYILLTHLHMDHAGNAWIMLKHMPKAKVVIDRKAIKHLIDPRTLVESSRSVLGSIIDRWGTMQPIEEDRIIGISDNQTLEFEGNELRFIATPGHAPFHFSILKDDELFTGDAVGIRVKDRLRPASPLPSFRLDLALQSLNKIMDIKPTRLYMPHFGISDDPASMLKENISVYNEWAEIIGSALDDEDKAVKLLNERFNYDEILSNDFLRTLFISDVKGFMRSLSFK